MHSPFCLVLVYEVEFRIELVVEGLGVELAECLL